MPGQEPGDRIDDQAGKGNRQALAVDQFGNPMKRNCEGRVNLPEDDIEHEIHADDSKISSAPIRVVKPGSIIVVPAHRERDRDHERVERLDGAKPGPVACIFTEFTIFFIDLICPIFTGYGIHIHNPSVFSALCVIPSFLVTKSQRYAPSAYPWLLRHVVWSRFSTVFPDKHPLQVRSWILLSCYTVRLFFHPFRSFSSCCRQQQMCLRRRLQP